MATWQARPLRVLDFDCENRPLSYKGRDFTTPEITVIAWRFLDEKDIQVVHQPEWTLSQMLEEFVRAYSRAEVVTGHNIIRHDLRLLNAMLLEASMEPLGPKMVHDTWAHLKRRTSGFGSQEDLAAYLGIRSPKVRMGTRSWRRANRMEPDGVDTAVARAVGDVRQHVAMRKKLLELGWLKTPRRWTP